MNANKLALATLLASTLIITQPAFAQSAAYSTDMEEVDVATMRNENCCETTAIRQDANVRLRVKHALYHVMPLTVKVMDENNQQVASFSTHDKVIYMRLPEGRYVIKVSAIVNSKTFQVDADDGVLKSFAI
jgi:hypothetical protein